MQKLYRSAKVKLYAPLAVMVLVGSVGAYIISAGSAQTITENVTCLDATSGGSMPVLSVGSKNDCVRYLQSGLQNLSYSDAIHGTLTKKYDVGTTGIYDESTQKAIIDFQARLQKFRCSASVNSGDAKAPATDGTVDLATWYFVTNLSGKVAFSNGNYSCGPGNLFAD